jgi:hypothetical protein
MDEEKYKLGNAWRTQEIKNVKPIKNQIQVLELKL